MSKNLIENKNNLNQDNSEIYYSQQNLSQNNNKSIKGVNNKDIIEIINKISISFTTLKFNEVISLFWISHPKLHFCMIKFHFLELFKCNMIKEANQLYFSFIVPYISDKNHDSKDQKNDKFLYLMSSLKFLHSQLYIECASFYFQLLFNRLILEASKLSSDLDLNDEILKKKSFELDVVISNTEEVEDYLIKYVALFNYESESNFFTNLNSLNLNLNYLNSLNNKVENFDKLGINSRKQTEDDQDIEDFEKTQRKQKVKVIINNKDKNNSKEIDHNLLHYNIINKTNDNNCKKIYNFIIVKSKHKSDEIKNNNNNNYIYNLNGLFTNEDPNIKFTNINASNNNNNNNKIENIKYNNTNGSSMNGKVSFGKNQIVSVNELPNTHNIEIINTTHNTYQNNFKNKNISSYKFENFKREDINKNVLRRFKKFVRKFFVNNNNCNINSNSNCNSSINNNSNNNYNYNSHAKFLSCPNIGILRHFIKLNILPPMSFTLGSDIIEFKSFNSSYIYWLFSHPGIKELFALFLEEKMEDFLKEMDKKLRLRLENTKDKILIEEDLLKIRKYLVDFCELYDIKTNPSCLYQKLVDNYYKKRSMKAYITDKENSRKNKSDKSDKSSEKKKAGSHFDESTYSSDSPDKIEYDRLNVNKKIENILNANDKMNKDILKKDYTYFKNINGENNPSNQSNKNTVNNSNKR